MKLATKHNIFFAVKVMLLLVFSFSVLYPLTSEAKTTSWSDTFTETLFYAWTRGLDTESSIHGWSKGLQNPNVTITYAASIQECETGANIADGSSIPVGSVIRPVPKEFEDTDIYWFGTGFSEDSPYGHWVANAGIPSDQSCHEQDFVENVDFIWGHYELGIYVPLNVDPPQVDIDLSASTAGLNDLGNGCYEVTSGGEIKTNFTFNDTYGKFYYRFRDYDDGRLWEYDDVRDGNCIANDFPMTLNWGKREFVMDVPERDIDFTLTAVPVAVNNPPNPPVITGSSDTISGQLETFTFTATDPDNDDIRYHIDWDMDGVVDELQPTDDTFIPSGTPDTAEHSWGNVETYTFQAKTQDEPGLFSDWTVYTVTVGAENKPPNPPIITGASMVEPDQTETYTFTATDPDNDDIRYHIDWDMDGVVDTIRPVNNTFIPSGTPDEADYTLGPVGTYTFQAYTEDEPGLTSGWSQFTVVVGVANRPPNPPVIDGATLIEPNQTETYTFTATDPDNDDIRYHIDWNMDGLIDAIRPADSSFIPSGTTDSADQSWNIESAHTFQAYTEDEHGLTSDWSQYTVDVDSSCCGGGGPNGDPVITSCSASPNPINVNEDSTWSAVITGGDAPFTYSWQDASSNEIGTSDTLTLTYTSPGNKGVILTVTDDDGASDTRSCDVLVVEDPTPKCMDVDASNYLGPLPCIGGGGGGSNPNITASDLVVYAGDPVTITWDPDANMCTLSNNIPASANINTAGGTNVLGSEVVIINSMTTFTMYCGVAGDYSVTVQAIPVISET